MAKFENLTKYLKYLENDNFGEWVIDNKSKGTLEEPIQMPFVAYSDMICHFEKDVYDFECSNKEMGLNRYSEILEKNGIEWSTKSMESADISKVNAQCVMALLMGAIRAERFCDGSLLSFFESGCIQKWLVRLNEIDTDEAR